MEQGIVDSMRALGFSASQARVYVSLLKQQPATGYELARSAEVPRSAIYNVLGQLQGLGLVNTVQQRPAKYAALPPARLFELMQSRFSSNLDALKNGLEQLDTGEAGQSTWSVRGYDALIDHAKALVSNSAHSVHASLWGREARLLAPALRRACADEVEVLLFSFNPLPRLPARCFSYRIDERELERYWPHRLLLISDRRRLLVGDAALGDENRAVITEEAALVEMALSNLVLDLTLFGERSEVDTSAAVRSLTSHLAPIEQLLQDAGGHKR